MDEKFFPKYRKFIHFLEKTHKRKIKQYQQPNRKLYRQYNAKSTKKEIQNIKRNIQPNNAPKKWMD
ncbi:hypothetical protein A9505_02070 [Methanobrevibacter sp. A27]|nr:hypothetical protein A9505_02070 [Methanobrevibacter sp. A27]